jgi:hypothetical protein
MRLLALIILISAFNSSAQTETEILTNKILVRLDQLEENYLIKLNRRDFNRAKVIMDELYIIVEDLRNPDLYAMKEVPFQLLKNSIRNEPFSSDRMNIIKAASQQNNFNVHQVLEIVELLNYSSERTEAVSILYPWIIDKDNSILLISAMKFTSEKNEVIKIMERYK